MESSSVHCFVPVSFTYYDVLKFIPTCMMQFVHIHPEDSPLLECDILYLSFPTLVNICASRLPVVQSCDNVYTCVNRVLSRIFTSG